MQKKLVSSWKQRARVSKGSSTAKEVIGSKQAKRRGYQNEEAETPRKRGKKINAEEGKENRKGMYGSGMAVAAQQPRRPQ
jgi:hypothetical protein